MYCEIVGHLWSRRCHLAKQVVAQYIHIYVYICKFPTYIMAITGLSQYIAMDNTKQTKHIVTVNEQLHRKQVYVR